eukprot:TRINITY_DN38130_c0_g1_i1.p1 TRINITY_DN38130_c0_g1~~TRINITY_DN38130_c0_g1_i1.p1  ORF type:complete len:218 (+),score=21.29 TRINITY_DN38130_c0_g1_i1:69-722(+)
MTKKRQASLCDMFGWKASSLDSIDEANDRPTKRRKAASTLKENNQMLLDLGQKDLGANRCARCGMVFVKGTEDEAVHKKFCGKQSVKLTGWTEEDVVCRDMEKGLLILSCSPGSSFRKKLEAALKTPLGEYTVFCALKQSSKTLLGSLLIDPSPPAPYLRGLVTFLPLCTTTDIASALLSAAKEYSIHGYTLKHSQIACHVEIRSYLSDLEGFGAYC